MSPAKCPGQDPRFQTAGDVAEVACPQCGKWYLPAGWMSLGGPVDPEAKDVCPHCNADRGEWYRKQAGRKGKGKS